MIFLGNDFSAVEFSLNVFSFCSFTIKFYVLLLFIICYENFVKSQKNYSFLLIFVLFIMLMSLLKTILYFYCVFVCDFELVDYKV